MIGNEFSVIFCKFLCLGLGAWCCLHLYCAYPSPITQAKSQKTWSRWVRHMLNKIFPVVEDKCSSSRSVEQFRSIPGLSSHWGSAARCFSAESCWEENWDGGIWWYSWPTKESCSSHLSPSCSLSCQNILGKKLHVRPSADHSSASCRV